MSKNFFVEIITPTNQININKVDYLRLPGLNGLFGIMNNHSSILVSLAIGEIKVNKSGNSEYFATSGGVLDFFDNKAQLLLETIEQASSIDLKRAEESQQRAIHRLKDIKLDGARSQIALARAINRIKVSKRS